MSPGELERQRPDVLSLAEAPQSTRSGRWRARPRARRRSCSCIVEAASSGFGRLAGLRRVRQEDRLRVGQRLQAPRHVVVDLERRHDDADDPRPPFEHRRPDDVVEPAAREPDPLRLRPLERPRDRSARARDRPRTAAGGRCARSPCPAGRARRRSRPGRSTPARASACRRPSRRRAGPSTGSGVDMSAMIPGIVDDDRERALERGVARLLERLPGRAPTSSGPRRSWRPRPCGRDRRRPRSLRRRR